MVLLPNGTTVLLDVSPPLLSALVLEGDLVFDDTAQEEIHLQVNAQQPIVQGSIKMLAADLTRAQQIDFVRVSFVPTATMRLLVEASGASLCCCCCCFCQQTACICAGAGAIHPGQGRHPAGWQ
jgi:hypothetical protein